MSTWKKPIMKLCCWGCGKSATHEVFYNHDRIPWDTYNEYLGVFCDECVDAAVVRVDAAVKQKESELQGDNR